MEEKVYWRGSFGIEITEKCNLNCAHCMRDGSHNNEISMEIIDKLLDFSDKFERIDFMGGEPTLALDKMKYLLEEAKRKNVKIYSIGLVTNGTGFSKEFYDVIYEYNKYIKQCLEQYVEKEVSDECIRTHIAIAISDDEYHEVNAVGAYKEAMKLNFDKIAFVTLHTVGNMVSITKGRSEKIGNRKMAERDRWKIGVSQRNNYCPYCELMCETEKNPTVLCDIFLFYDGKLGTEEYPYADKIICNIMETDSILDEIDCWNSKTRLFCSEAKSKNISYIDMDKTVEMLCDRMKHNKNFELLGIEKNVDHFLFYQFYGKTKEEIEAKLDEMEPKIPMEKIIWDYRYNGEYTDIHILYPYLTYEECLMLSIRQNNLLKNRQKILSLKHENYLRAVKAEIRDKRKDWETTVEIFNAFKRKYDKGYNPDELFEYYKDIVGDDVSYEKFEKDMKDYMNFSKKEKDEVADLLLDKLKAFAMDNIEKEKSMLFEDMVLHYICYCEVVEDILSDSIRHEKAVEFAKLYKTFLIDLLSLDALVFGTQNTKDKRLGRKPTFKESEIKEASEKMYKSHAMMKKFKQVCNALENLQYKK